MLTAESAGMTQYWYWCCLIVYHSLCIHSCIDILLYLFCRLWAQSFTVSSWVKDWIHSAQTIWSKNSSLCQSFHFPVLMNSLLGFFGKWSQYACYKWYFTGNYLSLSFSRTLLCGSSWWKKKSLKFESNLKVILELMFVSTAQDLADDSGVFINLDDLKIIKSIFITLAYFQVSSLCPSISPFLAAFISNVPCMLLAFHWNFCYW